MPPHPAASSIACVLIPHFGLRVALLDHAHLDGEPLLLGAPAGEQPRVADATPEATAYGIRPEMNLREALSLCPEAITLTPDPARETRVWEQVLSRLEALSPRVEASTTMGTAYLDLSGLARSLGSPEVAAWKLLTAAFPVLRPRVGIAPGKFAALAATRTARSGRSRIVAPAELAAFLAKLPADWLPLPPKQLQLLQRLGLTTMGALTALPPAAVAARLGPAGRRAWTLAAGRSDHDDSFVQSRPPVLIALSTLDLPHPTADHATFLRYLDLLVERAFHDASVRGRAVRQATVGAMLDGGGSWERCFALKGATGKDRLLAKLRLRLGQVELPGVVTTLWLELAGITSEAAWPGLLPGLHPRQPTSLTEVIEVLTTRYGASPIYRIVGMEPWSRIPERRYALAPYVP